MEKSNMINITKAKYYFRWYPSEWQVSTSLWWYNAKANKMIAYNDIDPYSKNQKEALIPVPLINMTDIEKDFLDSIERSKDIDAIADRNPDFDCSFKTYIDYNSLVNAWHQFEGERLESIAISWCKKNKIRYTI